MASWIKRLMAGMARGGVVELRTGAGEGRAGSVLVLTGFGAIAAGAMAVPLLPEPASAPPEVVCQARWSEALGLPLGV
jgi:hypothetical protein